MTDTEIIERVEAWIRDAVPRIRTTHSGADVDLGGLPRVFGRAIFEWREVSSRWGPTGGAACGALLEIVSEAHGVECRIEWGRRCETLGPEYGRPIEWLVWGMDQPLLGKGTSKIEALLVALEAAPR